MVVKRTGGSGYWTFNEQAGYTRLYRDDVGSLLALIEDRGATAKLVSGSDVKLESSEDIPSLSSAELSDLTIKTRNPELTISLHRARARAQSFDDGAEAIQFGATVIGFLRQHRASGWERIGLELLRNRKTLLMITLVTLVCEAIAVAAFGLSPLYLLFALGPLAVYIVVALLSGGTGTWVSRSTRADATVSREKRTWQVFSYIGTTVFGGIVGYVVGHLN